jgi:hypothetical protein
MESPDFMDSVTLEYQLSDQLMLARMLLKPRVRRDPAWPALAAAAFFAVTAMTFAVTAIMTPARDYAPLPAVESHK